MDIHNLTPDEKRQSRDQYLQSEYPYSISLSLGEFDCNQRCRMCPMYTAPPAVKRTMSTKVVQKACSDIGDREVSLEISAYGETFQHPEANAILGITRKMCPNAHIIVATNGSFLDEDRCEAIVDSGIDILQFSLDAGSAESHKWLTGTTHYDRLVRNLERLIETRVKRGADHLKIFTHIMGIKELEHEFDDFVSRWSPHVDLAHVRQYGNWAGLVDDNGITPAQKQVIPDERYPCSWLWYATKIEPNGDISKCFIHCTGEKDPLGNIMDSSLESVWKGEKARRVRQLHQIGRYDELEFCKNCIVWSLFPHFWEATNDNKRWE